MSVPLPPSGRDFQIYQRLQLDGLSTRQAAADFSLSQTRIRQIVQHVAHWLAQSLPPSCEATDAAWIRLAQHIAADRLQLIYGEAMHGWRATHESKYAGVILRVTAAMGKMPVTAGALDALLADALEGPLPEEVESPTSKVQGNSPVPTRNDVQPTLDLGPGTLDSGPPSGDCSPILNSPPPPAQTVIVSPVLTALPQKASDNLPATQTAARRAFLAPAHPPNNSRNDEPITELQITPKTLGFTTKKPLSRRDRRRLRRLAASK